MGWGQKNARFFMEVHSQRQNPERILGSRESGIRAVLAGERGALYVAVYAVGSEDRFHIHFKEWRKSEKAGSVQLMRGLLDFDRFKAGEVNMNINNELLEALSLIRAKEIITQGTAAEDQ